MWSNLKNYADGALLTTRILFGTLCLYIYGWPALAGGVKRWALMGQTMKHVGITFAPTFWGFLGACSESLGCLLLIIGFLFRPSCLVLFLTLLVVVISECLRTRGGALGNIAAGPEMTILLFFVFTLFFVGPGRFSVDKG